MSRILNQKTRMIDTIVTLEGRRQMAQGKLKVEFVSFTDADTFYQADALSGSADVSQRVLFEACSLPQDQITFEADDAGKLMPYRGSSLGLLDGKIISGSTSQLTIVTGSVFASLSDTLLLSSIENFNKNCLISDADQFFDDEREFSTNVDLLEFTVTNTVPFADRRLHETNVDKIESLFQDKRLSNVDNFLYLPPVNVTRFDGTKNPLGNFPSLGQRMTPISWDDIKASLMNKETKTIEFTQTSLKSNVVCQMFEAKQDLLSKLDVIDFGDVQTDDASAPVKRIFFAGKVFIDSFGAQTFVNMFVLIFE
jgi:hypothetical protein